MLRIGNELPPNFIVCSNIFTAFKCRLNENDVNIWIGLIDFPISGFYPWDPCLNCLFVINMNKHVYYHYHYSYYYHYYII